MSADPIAQFRCIFPDVSEARIRELIEACTGNVEQAIELFLSTQTAPAKAAAHTAASAGDDEDEAMMILAEKPAATAGRKRKDAAATSSSKPAASAAASAASSLSSPSKRSKNKLALTPSKDDKQHSLASFWRSPVASTAAASSSAPKAAPSKLTAAMRSRSRMEEAARATPAAAAAASSSSYTAAASSSSAAAAAASSPLTSFASSPPLPSAAAAGGSSSFFSVASSSAAAAAASSSADCSDPLRPCWSPRSPVPFVFLSRIFALIEAENGRIKITNWLTYAFWQILAYTPADLPAALFLSSDQLAPSYLNHQLGVGGSTLVKLVSEMTGVGTSKLSADHARLGDLGLIAAQYRMTQTLLFRPAPLTIAHVFASFHSLGEISKRDKKEALLKKLFAAARESEFLYLIRIAEGGLRIGAVVTTVLSALAKAFTLHHLYCEGVPEERRHEVCTFDRVLKATDAVKAATKAGVQPFQLDSPSPGATPAQLTASIARRLPSHLAQATAKLRRAYAELPSFHDIIPVLMRSPTTIYELHKHIQLTAGIPIKPQLGRPMQSIMRMLKLFRGLPFSCEVKYDGLRAQIHRLSSGAYRIFSRHLMDQRDRWDDLVPFIDAARKKGEGDRPKADSFIIDAEIVAIEHMAPTVPNEAASASSSAAAAAVAPSAYRILPFQQLSTRRRKGDSLQANGEKRTEVSCMVYVFDFLSLNGESLLLRSLPERRALMAQTFDQREGEFQFVEFVDFTAAATRDLDFDELEEDEEAAKGKAKASPAKGKSKDKKGPNKVAAATMLDDDDAASEGSSDDDVEEIKRDAADDEESALMRMASTGAVEESKEADAAAASSSASAASADFSNSAASTVASAAASAASSVTDVITAFLNSTAIPRGEGLMAKSLAPGSTYEPDVRTDQWCKLKKDFISGMGVADSIDVVVIGAWHGNGRKAGWLSPFLVAVYNPDTEEYESFAKVMSGFSDAVYKQLTAECDALIVPTQPKYYRVSAGMTPTLWFKPVKVWEIRGADLTISPIHQAACGLVHESRGISLRFPRFIRVRDDKGIEQATTSDEIARMYRGQSIVQHQRPK